jgi:hypothetical protein
MVTYGNQFFQRGAFLSYTIGEKIPRKEVSLFEPADFLSPLHRRRGGHWSLGFGAYLGFGVWDLEFTPVGSEKLKGRSRFNGSTF